MEESKSEKVYPVTYRQNVSCIAYAEVIMWCVPYRPISGHTISEFREIAFFTEIIYGRRSTRELKIDLIAEKERDRETWFSRVSTTIVPSIGKPSNLNSIVK